MDAQALRALLDNLIAGWENEVAEFKRAGNDYSTDNIGKYFSALANEANLRNQERAWLVFGVDNNTRKAVGTDYRVKATASKAEYIRTRGLDDGHYKQLIIDLLTQFGSASRQDIDRLLLSKLSDALDEQQKLNKVGNLLTSLRRAGRITNSGPRKAPLWVLAE
ncbi:hypothetical protein PS934_04044 [Pseudomonas fluorescens]|uniref:ATP-binding protein n=1 Tax=Pseudomonas fluorescens TaxID=294 RepID=UPI001242CF66|nr:ATP-binding protein [Pseudomonas fluorescens]VVQ14060.1 hypothetical protein PS934_04044 [Pseudomonas fluorescens]